ncbi:hypothetical protein REC12_17930 [Desulfosporosinus sp. PR]|uniref:hypothetical protein n=1 Tax=Candidatus Desulfosporosinus nitrosoreducens TaxID=3401928 RepID=UPI0027F78278|nr:hypothetical protein [Desulfosporosinus sp. PR]MDQ7095472.1 hypothetical protein [Desulfosporosinus sp. PR]
MKFSNHNNVNLMNIAEVIHRIIRFTEELNKFWSSAQGWAPIEAAQLLTKSRLDWQVSLAHYLSEWEDDPISEKYDGGLILAWSNLGSLVEGTMKLFLSVYYMDYQEDVNAIKKRDKLVDSDRLELEQLRQFFIKRIWLNDSEWKEWVLHVQQRRNAIHSFRDRKIGSFDDLRSDVRRYLEFIRYHNSRLPYPDEVFCPFF